jgi:hypothetical protein
MAKNDIIVKLVKDMISHHEKCAECHKATAEALGEDHEQHSFHKEMTEHHSDMVDRCTMHADNLRQAASDGLDKLPVPDGVRGAIPSNPNIRRVLRAGMTAEDLESIEKSSVDPQLADIVGQ